MTQKTFQKTGWREVTLGEVAEVQNGYAFKASDFSSQGIFVIKIKNVASGEINLKDVGFYDNETSKLEKFFIEKGDILVSMTGSHISQISSAVGKVAIYKLNKKALLNQRVGNIKPKNGVDKKYLSFLLSQPNVQIFWGNKAGGSANQANISPNIIKSYQFLLPPLPEQRAIAAVLSSLDDKIELLREQNKTLEETAQMIFGEWFGKYWVDRPEELPEGWRVGIVGNFVDIRGGATPSTKNPDFWDGNIAWTSPKDLSNSKEMFLLQTEKKITEEGLKQISSGLLPKGTLLLSSRAPIGYLAISSIEMAINQGYIAFLPNQYFSNYFMLLWLKANMKAVIGAANGSTFLEISKSSFKKIECVAPPRKLLEEFNILIRPLFEKILSNLNQIQTLSTLRDALLPKLMRGEVKCLNRDFKD